VRILQKEFEGGALSGRARASGGNYGLNPILAQRMSRARLALMEQA